jgi:co-chaperonin GroES (HSP10)
MSDSLFVPDHIARERANKKAPPPPPEDNGLLAEAYVDANEVVLDPTKIPESAMERLPTPTGWRVLILPYQGKKKTDGGIILTSEFQEKERVATVCGYVLKVGPLAYKDLDKFGDDVEPWCKEGDWVIFGRYAGSRFKIEGGEVRILNDDEIIARISSPDDILHL